MLVRDWSVVRLGDHAQVKARIGWRGLSAREYTEDGPFLIAGQHLAAGQVDWSSCDHLSEFRYEESPEIALRAGDVILSKDGTIGRIARIDSIPGRATLNGTMMLVRPKATLDYRFLYHVLGAQQFQKVVQDKVSGSSIPHIFQRDMVGLELALPCLPEQRCIADILDAADKTIRKTEQVIAKLAQMRRGLLHDLLTRGVDDNGELRDPEKHPEQFRNTPLGRVPRRWEVEQLSSRFEVRGGKRLPAGHTYSPYPTPYRYLRVLDFFGKAVEVERLQYLRPATFEALRPYEIVDSNLFISIAGSIGQAGVYRATPGRVDRTILTENAARLAALRDDCPDFVAVQINHDGVQRQIAVEKGTGGGVPKLALFRIELLRLVWPPVEEQRAIADISRHTERCLRTESESLIKLQALRKGLADDLLSGRVRLTITEESSA